MIKVIYAMVNNEMPEDFVDDLFFAEGEYEIMLFDSPIIAEVNGEMQEFPEHHCIYTSPAAHSLSCKIRKTSIYMDSF